MFKLCSNAFILQKKSAVDNRKFENMSVTAQGEVFFISTGSHSIVDILTDESYQDFSQNLEIEVRFFIVYFLFICNINVDNNFRLTLISLQKNQTH